ncbi:TlpA family protein disulfide reductase [Carboxylicivirga sp. M1479]|nr:TlpA family protein disulfide reductase [Carboxylicivirga sp. M1479]
MLAQEVENITISQLKERVAAGADTLYVINFWATWCHPCVEELPIFESDEVQQLGSNLKVLLVSLDFKSQKEKQLLPFLSKRQIKPEVVLLDERNPNEWIDKIDATWSGAIPATVVYHQKKKAFHEGEMDVPSLLELISNVQ